MVAKRITATAAVLVALLSHDARAQQRPRLVLTPCTVGDSAAPASAQCGKLSVYENRTTMRGRKIELRIVVLPATGRDRAPDPVFFIAGGPGSSIVDQAGGIARDAPGLRARRDLVLIDQRGTGGSHPINCEFYGPPDSLQSYLGDFTPPASVRRCRDEFSKTTDFAHYITTVAIDDLDEVRAALGAERINFSGGSYGTRAAQEYMRRYPTRVRAVTLFGAVPPSEHMPQHFARDAQESLDDLVADCAADAACRASFPRLAHDIRTVFDRLAREPARVTLDHPRSGKPVTVSLSYDMVAETLRYMLYVSADAALIPAAMRQAANGDFTWLARRALRARGGMTGEGTFDGLYLAITCLEDVQYTDSTREAAEAKGTFLGEYRMHQQRAACAQWGRPRHPPADYHTPVQSSAPVLLVTGAQDPVTPPHYAAEVARSLPNSLTVVVPFGAHGLRGLEGLSCIDQLQREVIERGSVTGLDTSCVSKIRRRGFPTELPAVR